MALVGDLYRVTWYWEALGQGGSETMMLRRQDSNTGSVLDGITQFLLKRAQLLGNQGTLRACRCAKYTDTAGARVRNISELRYFSFQGTQTTGNQPNLGENLAQSLQLMCYEPVSQRKKIIYLGYPWEAVLPGNQIYAPVGAWGNFFSSWLTDLVQGGWGWIRKERSIPYAITGYTEDANTGRVTITTAGAITWPNSDRPVEVHISFAGKNPLDGRQLVQPVSSNSCTTVAPIGVRNFSLTTGGFLRLYDPFFASLNPGFPATTNLGRVGVVQPVRRARGKPTPSTRGRSPDVVRW